VRAPLALLLILLSVASARAEADRPGRFDFYVLALSWSPSFCANERSRASTQCRLNPPKGFVVHGLWPQHERGYPESCPTSEPYRVPRSLIDTVLDIMPSPALVGGQWRKHGTCTGLNQEAYLAAIRRAYETVNIPESLDGDREARESARAIEDAFIAANPGLSANAIAVACRDGRLSEIRICMTKDFAFRPCPEVDRRGCRDRRLQVPAAR